MKRWIPGAVCVGLLLAAPPFSMRYAFSARPSSAEAAAPPTVAKGPTDAAKPRTSGLRKADGPELLPQVVLDLGITIRVPEGFEPHPQHPGFRNEALDASVLVFEMPQSFGDVMSRFTGADMHSRGLVLHGREPVEIDGQPGVLVIASQEIDGKTYQKAIGIVGDHRRSWMITATYPRSAGRELVNTLRESVLSTTFEADRGPRVWSGLPFHVEIDPDFGFTFAQRTANGLTWTRDGLVRTESPDRATFTVEAQRAGRVGSLQAAAEAKLRAVLGTEAVVIRYSQPASINGRPAWESLGAGVYAGTGQPCLIHQVVVFDDAYTYTIRGVAHAAHANPTLDQFQQITGAFRIDPPVDALAEVKTR